ncbi:MAG: endonuclease V [Thermoplasmata archaeon]
MDLFSIFYALVKQIPPGRVSTYGSLANALGDPIAARAVGVMLSQNPEPVIIPCHRVVSSDGTLGGFTHPNGISEKINLLRREGVTVDRGRIIDFKNILFTDFKSDYPLQKLKKEQIELSKKVILQDSIDSYFVTGVDVSYFRNLSFIAFVKFNLRTGDIVSTKTYIDTVSFPYIPTYFSYREGDLILKYADKDGILIIDGNGILHPSRFGIASYVGVKLDITTIGVAKSLLTGNVLDNRIYLDDALVGKILQKNYISPGHKISIESAYKIIKNLTKKGSPEPIKLAHNTAKDLRNEYCGGQCSGPF